MHRIGPATVLSVLLHVGLFLLLFLSWKSAPKPSPVVSVPVELVSSVPMHEQAEAPVDKLAVKTPVPEPAPEEPVKPEPTPPAPKLPVPAPIKPVVTPTPKPTPAPPDKNGVKKPEPPKPEKPTLDLTHLAQTPAAPSQAKTRQLPQANTHPTNGASNSGSAPQDTGTNATYAELAARLMKLWSPNCDVPGGDKVVVQIKFTISPNGRVIEGPTWINPRNDPVWEAGAARAMQAVKRGEPYVGLPDIIYSKPIPPVEFDAAKACHGQ